MAQDADVNISRATFAAGEVSSTLHARDDLARTNAALALCENFFVLFEGGIARTPGTRFLFALKDEAGPAALIPFRYSEGASYIQCINGGVMRVIKAGGAVVGGVGTPFELAVPYVTADSASLRYAQLGTAQFVSGGNKRPQMITWAGDASWTIVNYPGVRGPVGLQNITATTFSATGVVGTVTVTCNGQFAAGDEGAAFRIDANPGITPQWRANETGLAGANQRRNIGNYYEVMSGTDSGVNAPVHTQGEALSASGFINWRFIHPGYGYCTVVTVLNANQATCLVTGQLPTEVGTPSTLLWSGPEWKKNLWPTGLTIHQGRLVHTRDNRLWGTRSGNLFDFGQGINDDDALALSLFSQRGEMTKIEWVVSSGALMLGTHDGEWLLRGADQSDPVTPLTLPFPNSREGSATHVPELVDEGVVFVGRSRKRLHYLKFDGVSGRATLVELTKAARHILKGRADKLAWQRDPNRVLWVGCLNGDLIGATLMPDEQVVAFHRHPLTNGFVEALAVLPNADETATDLYLQVRRTINGATRRFVEILAPFFEPADPDNPTVAGAWFVDCGLRYQGAPATVITGLSHLNGENVHGLADARQVGPLTVSGGSVTLPFAAADVILGLKKVARAKSLPFEQALSDGSSKGKVKKIKHVHLDVLDSAGGALSSNGGRFEQLMLTGDLDYGGPIRLFTNKNDGSTACGFDAPPLESPSAETAQVEILCDNVLPFTLTGWTPQVTISG